MASHKYGEVMRSQRLRYQVFSEEMGAQLETRVPGVDQDIFDEFCEHLIVVDMKVNEIVATTRIISNASAEMAGGFYSETEFNIDNITKMQKNFLEIGRTCVHPAYRTSSAINHLWQGVAKTMLARNADFVFGCVSIPMNDGGEYISTLMQYLRENYAANEDLRVMPKVPMSYVDVPSSVKVVIPSLLKRYLNIGALVCGEPCFDKDFNVADIFVLIDAKKIDKRYERHFFYGA
jgi:putative hemolysin